MSRPYQKVCEKLRHSGLRPTRQRLALGKLLLDGEDRHVTAEQLHQNVLETGMQVSLATVYNTLNQFTRAGLLKEIVVESGRSYFDTNMRPHHHFFCEDSGRLTDIDADAIPLGAIPAAPEGTEVTGVEVIVRLKSCG
jgi:Fur family iron response transcriptional regulator